jgi:hypothetical protein
MNYTHAEFESLSWHDCHIWGIELRTGSPEDDDWTSELVLDIDFITDWLCGVDRRLHFRVAPATLVFMAVTDLRINIDWGDTGFRMALHELSIDRIERQPTPDPHIYHWRIRTNWPDSGEIAFGATRFTQVLRAEPVLTDRPILSFRKGSRLAEAR